METLISLLEKTELGSPLSEEDGERLASELGRLAGMWVYPTSIAAAGGAVFFLGRPCEGTASRGRRDTRKSLGILFRTGRAMGFVGEEQAIELDGQRLVLKLCPTNHANADALRRTLPYTAPRVLGLRKSFGCGDRLGLATPGHVRAVRRFSGIAPIFAQQSARENARTGRTPQQVVDDAMWGVFQEGWREPWGADADHLKTLADVDACVAARYTFYTVDPGDYVDNEARSAQPAEVKAKVQALPWDALEDTVQDMERRYLDRSFDLGDFALAFDREALWRAAAKYGRAISHTVRMYRHLADRMGDRPFEFEVSVDETETPTSPAEHLFIASELRRLEVRWVSLAPRFVGRFEKGVDYIGDLDRFEAEFIQHVAVARAMGPYKLSLHSGSDKFSVYPIIARHAGNLVHVKTAGTSYLEALRALADLDPALFREILAFAFECYGEDKATYHVSADLSKVPAPDQLADSELAGALDLFDGRQLLHVTYGSVLTARDATGTYRFRDRLLGALQANEETVYAMLEAHFAKHLAPFAG